jgi:hypothetical protein
VSLAARLRLAQHRYHIATGGGRTRALRALQKANLAALRADIRRRKAGAR